ncbi:HET-domain-containing protein, partial [Cubamyces sp. BRFM 1775]
MRLLDTETGRFLEIANPTDLPYAILSHTWDPKGEQTYQDIRKIQATYEAPGICGILLFYIGCAIRGACAYARADGNKYIWIDSCCIDKSSSAELSEAINSMYIWYQTATVCYVFLSDVTGRSKGDMDHDEFFYSRWHTRGWTLQELLAPAAVVFLSRHWLYLGTKFTLALQLERRLGIPYSVLTRAVPMEDVSVAQRFSWAAQRETTRAEDRAYCLLGVFGVTMPPLYGEGNRAFHRLQQAIWAQRPDHSIFAW